MAEQKAGLARLSTGVSGLDQIVRGGFFRGGVYIVSGPPGSGKTIFGNQLCFSQAREGKHALFLTLLAESHGRMVRHLEGFSFFVPEEVDRSVFYVSGYHALKAGGLPALSKLMRQQVREKRPSVLVLDGLQAAEEAATSKLEYREFLHELGVHNALVGCTTVVLTTEEAGSGNDPEFAMVDGTIRFTNELYGLKAIRGLEVAKFRGAGQLPGKHTFLIDDHGVSAFPRTEALYTQVPTTVPDPKKRKAFGIPSLDAMLHGGLVADSCTLMLGSPGVGKTTLGLAFLVEGAARGERGLYYGFAESAPRLLQKSETLELGLGPHVKAGRIHLEARAALETVPDALVQDLFARIEREKITRLFVDGLEPFSREALDPERTSRFVAALTNVLRERKVTSIMTQQTNSLVSTELFAPMPGVEAIFDNILFLRFLEHRAALDRLLLVMKMRDSDNDRAMRRLEIAPGRIEVGEPFTGFEDLLTGQARSSGLAAPPNRGPAKPTSGRGERRATRKTTRRRR